MDVAQMLAHCSSFQDIAMGNSFPPRSWLGIIVGRFAKQIVYNDKTLPHNMSTIPTILIANDREFETEKEKLKQKHSKITDQRSAQLILILFLGNSLLSNGVNAYTSTLTIILNSLEFNFFQQFLYRKRSDRYSSIKYRKSMF